MIVQEPYGHTSMPLRTTAYAEKGRAMVSSLNLEEHYLKVLWESDTKCLDRQVIMKTDSNTTGDLSCPVTSVPSGVSLDLSVSVVNSLTEERYPCSNHVRSVGITRV